MVTGNTCRSQASISTRSQAIFREYPSRLDSGVLSVISTPRGGFWYAEADEMKIYCPVFPSSSFTSWATCSG